MGAVAVHSARFICPSQPMIKPKERPASLTKQLSEQILGKMLADGLEQGEFFMTEEQFAAREAVNGLRALGFLESRRRKGLLVGAASPIELLSMTRPFFGRSKKNLRELSRLYVGVNRPNH